jgi:hypothetical protein
MKILLAILILNFSMTAMASEPATMPAANPCKNPQPLFGRIVAICGERMITFVGTQKVKVLGVRVSKSVFEMAYCENGGGRVELNLSTNSEGYTLTSEQDSKSKYEVINMWMEFKLKGTDYDGNPLDVACKPYVDNRKNIEYIY